MICLAPVLSLICPGTGNPEYYRPHPAMISHTSEEWDQIEEQCGPGLEAEFDAYMKSLKRTGKKVEGEAESGDAESEDE